MLIETVQLVTRAVLLTSGNFNSRSLSTSEARLAFISDILLICAHMLPYTYEAVRIIALVKRTRFGLVSREYDIITPIMIEAWNNRFLQISISLATQLRLICQFKGIAVQQREEMFIAMQNSI